MFDFSSEGGAAQPYPVLRLAVPLLLVTFAYRVSRDMPVCDTGLQPPFKTGDLQVLAFHRLVGRQECFHVFDAKCESAPASGVWKDSHEVGLVLRFGKINVLHSVYRVGSCSEILLLHHLNSTKIFSICLVLGFWANDFPTCLPLRQRFAVASTEVSPADVLAFLLAGGWPLPLDALRSVVDIR